MLVVAALAGTFAAAPAAAAGQPFHATDGLVPASTLSAWGFMQIPGARLTPPTQPQCSLFADTKRGADAIQTDFAYEAWQSTDRFEFFSNSARVFPTNKDAQQFLKPFARTVEYRACLTAQYTVPGAPNVTVKVRRTKVKVPHAATVLSYRVDATYGTVGPTAHVSGLVLFMRYENLITDVAFRGPRASFDAGAMYVEDAIRTKAQRLG